MVFKKIFEERVTYIATTKETEERETETAELYHTCAELCHNLCWRGWTPP